MCSPLCMVEVRFVFPAMPSSSFFVLRPSLFHSSDVLTRRTSFHFSPAQSYSETPSFYRRRFFIFSKFSPEPIESAPVESLHSEETEDFTEKKLQRDFYLEEMTCDEGFEIEVLKVDGKKNRRRIQSRVRVDADLITLWRVLTDYNGLANFIPSLAVSQLLEKRENFAKLYQVGEQNLALGLKFNAKGVLECHEGDLEAIPFGWRRDIEFRMVEGDFKTFEGKWYIEQIDDEKHEDGEVLSEREHRTTLSYIVEVEPKLWLPVRLLEGRLCREVKINLLCIRDEAQRIQRLETEGLVKTA
ncbi:uncharacterized protein LOC110034174 isoform X2 [Phalaenopsis equestris]|uniref:uncharacterized protein LOC110034174 isoform X2 n=1 Tax=Phalaenopsis equestris TaxID=78828 RepID=UPI0009E2578E|nr:uncharacterized protein LOC110034174 isoform X2 [Phalaenopsis equestris]